MPRWIFRFDPATVFLVLACVYFSTVGSISMAQNAAPSANAGMNLEVASGAMVRLDGSGSSARDGGTIVSYHWARTGGTSGNTLVLAGEDTARPTFTADRLFPGTADVTHEFTLTVTDDLGTSSTDMVTVTINSPNAIPVADAGGNQTVVSGAAVTLDGSDSSDGDGMVASYRWRRTGGTGNSGVVLTGANTARLRFTADTLDADVDGVTHIFELIVTDDEDAESVAVTVTVMVVAGNALPVADAGGDSSHDSSSGVLMVASGAMVRLDGRGSSARDGGKIKSYHWARTGGSGDRTIVLTGAGTARPTFTAETLAPDSPDRTHVFTLTVTDDLGATSTDRVWVLVSSPIGIPLHCHHHNPIGYPVFPPNKRPVADAGPDHTVSRPMTVILDGSDSYDPDGTIVAYRWYQWTSDDRDLLFRHGGNSSTPRFSLKVAPPGLGKDDWIQYFCLVVWDNLGVKSWGDTVTITATSRINADAGPDQTVASGATVTLDGSGSTVDSRRTPLTYSWARTGGTSSAIGTLTGATTAMPSFTVETRDAGAEDVTHILTLTVTDSAGETDTDTVEITVTSDFADPVAEAGDPQSVGSGLQVMLDGSGSTVDSRRTPLAYSWARTGGTGMDTGTLTDAMTDMPGFTAEVRDAGAPDVTHIFTLTVTDSANITSTDTVTITVVSGFAAPDAIITGGNREVASGGTINLDGSDSTHDDRTTLSYDWTRTGGTSTDTGTLTGAMTSMPGFTAETRDAGAPNVTHILTLTVTDSEGATDTATVTITVVSGFAAPDAIITGGNREVASGGTVNLDGSDSTHDDRTTLSYDWTRTGGTSTDTGTLTDAMTAMPSFTAETRDAGAPNVTHILTLTVTDSEGATDTATVTITVVSGFAAPDAIITGGNREVASGGTVNLDGSDSTHDDRTTLSYDWTRTGGTSTETGTLTGAMTAMPGFTAETRDRGAPNVTHILTLTVTDSEGGTDTARVTITVVSGFAAPDAIITGGNREVASGGTVNLDGSDSTHDDRTTLSYDWTRTGGTSTETGTLTGAMTAMPSFTAETRDRGAPNVTHILTLTVTDSEGGTDTARVTITVVSGFAAPDAIITGGNREVTSGGTVNLDGSDSTHDDRTTLSYDWTRTGGTSTDTGTLTGAMTSMPSFTAETLINGVDNVTHILTLMVTDSEGGTDTAMITITVVSGFAAPNAIITGGNREVASRGTVNLDGSDSTHDGRTTLAYSWTRTGGTSTDTGTLTDAMTAMPSFTAETRDAGAPNVTHILTLTVTDNEGGSDTDTVTITVVSAFAAPVAKAGDPRSVDSGKTVTLDGSGSTHDDRTTLSYDWTRTGGTSTDTGTLTGAMTSMPGFTAETRDAGAPNVTHILTLTVTDSEGATDTATVTITVVSGFAAPDAIITGGNREVASGGTVNLDGSDSTHDDRTTLSYDWTRTGGTSTDTGTLTDAMTAMPSFTAETRDAGAPNVTHILTLTVTDSEGATDTATVTITVVSGFAAPDAIITGGNREVASGGTVNLDGSDSTHDDRTTLSYDWTRTGGTSTETGTLTGAMTAMPGFTAETRDAGAPNVTHILTLTVTDSEGGTDTARVTITVVSGFAAPDAIITGGNREVASGGTVNLDGSDSTHDDRTTLSYDWTRTGGTSTETGTLTGAMTAMPSFTAETRDRGAPNVTHILTLTVTDSEGGTDTARVTITVVSGFAAPDAIITGGNREVTSGGTVNLDGSDSTHDDRTTLSYDWTRTGGTSTDTGTLTGAMTSMPSFTAETLINGVDNVTHILTLMVTDSEGGTDTAMITITVVSGFAAPNAIITGGNREVASRGTVNLDGSDSTHDGRTTLAYSWTRTGGTSTDTGTLTDAMTAMPSFTAETRDAGAPNVTHILTLTVTDNEGGSDTDTVTITVVSAFAAPVAKAGDPRSVDSGKTVTLDGSGSTHDDRTTLSYNWTRTGGTSTDTGTLTDAMTAMPSFTAETRDAGAPNVTHILTLTVTDNEGGSDTDTVTITVVSGFAAPVAKAGDPRSVDSGKTVTLDGSGSTHDDRTTLSYRWARIGGTSMDTGTLTDAMTAMPSFTAETRDAGAPNVTHILTLTVTDNEGGSDTDTVTITVVSAFAAPVAKAGDPRSVDSGKTVTLDGSGSTHDDRTTLSYSWTRTGGTSTDMGTLTGAMTATPGFTAETRDAGAPNVTHILTLTVTDNEGGSDTDTVTITVVSAFAAPVAKAGDPRSVDSGKTVTLDGSGSTHDDRTTLSYSWTRTGGTSTDMGTLTGAMTATPGFRAETRDAGAPNVTHILTLTVTDNEGGSDTDTVTITVVSVFAAPVAKAGDPRVVDSGGTVILDGSGSTHDNRTTLSYNWTRTGGTSTDTGTLTDAMTVTPGFTAEVRDADAPDVTHILTLTVTDSEGGTDTDTVTITVTSGFAAPVAEAGDPQSVGSGATVTLDGSGSTVDSRRTIAYNWERMSGTGGSVVLNAANTKWPTFRADTLAEGDGDVTHVFMLTVTDSANLTDTAMVTVTVLAPIGASNVAPVNILVSPSELTVQEGGSSAYQVWLSRSPGQEVIVEAVSENKDVILENARLMFNAENWGERQNVNISTVADSDKVDDKALIQHGFDTEGVALGQSGVVSITVREEDPILRPVGEYLAAHATALLNNQRKLILFLKQDGTIPGGSNEFTFNATNGRLALNGGFVRDGIWGEVTGSNTRSVSGDTSSVLGSFGLHWKNSERFLTGVMLQFYLAEHDLAGGTGSIDGAGWLAGPYFASRHGTEPLYYEGRVLYGRSDNDIRFNGPDLGERRGSFDTRRLLAQLRMEGEIVLEDGDYGPRLIPYADALWIKERAKGFTDSVGNRVPGQTVGIGHLEFGSNLEIPIVTAHGAMTFIGGLGVVYSNTESDYIRSESRGRGRVEMGFSYNRDDNVLIDFESYYDGIGTSKYESYGLKLAATLKF